MTGETDSRVRVTDLAFDLGFEGINDKEPPEEAIGAGRDHNAFSEDAGLVLLDPGLLVSHLNKPDGLCDVALDVDRVANAEDPLTTGANGEVPSILTDHTDVGAVELEAP